MAQKRSKRYEAAAKLGFKESDIDLGVLARKDMIDAKVADVAFGLKKDELSKPVEGQFKVVLVRVSDIVPGKQRTYEEVKNEIRDRLAEERASQEIQTLHEKVESERSVWLSTRSTAFAICVPGAWTRTDPNRTGRQVRPSCAS